MTAIAETMRVHLKVSALAGKGKRNTARPTADVGDDWHIELCDACGTPLQTLRRGADFVVHAHVCHPGRRRT